MDGDKAIHVNIYHGGYFILSPGLRYVGGAVFRRGLVDADMLSVPMIKELIEEFGYRNVLKLWWRRQEESMEEVRPLESDNEVIKLIQVISDGDTLEIYVEHGIEDEGTIPALPAPELVEDPQVGHEGGHGSEPTNINKEGGGALSELEDSDAEEDGDLFTCNVQKDTNEHIRQ